MKMRLKAVLGGYRRGRQCKAGLNVVRWGIITDSYADVAEGEALSGVNFALALDLIWKRTLSAS